MRIEQLITFFIEAQLGFFFIKISLTMHGHLFNLFIISKCHDDYLMTNTTYESLSKFEAKLLISIVH